MSTTPVWVPVPVGDVMAYLGQLGPRGVGSVRAASVHRATVTLDPAQPGPGDTAEVCVDVTDTLRGRWRVRFTGARVASAWGPWDEGDEPWPDSAFALQYGTWEIHDSRGHHYATGAQVGGRNTTTWQQARADALTHLATDASGVVHVHDGRHAVRLTFANMEVARAEAAGPAGTCQVCGSADFRLTARTTFPVRAHVDTHGRTRYVATAPDADSLIDTAALSPSSARVVCAQCGTPALNTADGAGVDLLIGDGDQPVPLSSRAAAPARALLPTGGQ